MDYNFKVNLGGMIDILANHLYSSPNVFVRELLQNGVDAISARKKEGIAFIGGRISIHVREGKEVRFCDNGIGLTVDEIHKFLSVIGETSKKDITTGRIYEDYIGRFGIGLLSCFMVTDQIIVRTRSVKTPDIALEWVGKPDGTYNINEIENAEVPIGTQVIITAKTRYEEYFSKKEIINLVRYYGLPLPFHVVLVEDNTETVINGFNFSGALNPSDVMELGKQLFDEKFLDFIPLESPKGLFAGVAFILPYETSPYNKHAHRIYLKNMLLTEDGEMILPKWAFFVKCFLNTTTLRPTASRENFYQDEELEEAKKGIARCISRYLVTLSRKNPELLRRIVRIHMLAIKSIAVTDDELFKIFIPHLEFISTLGDITGKEIIQYGETVYYASDIDRYRQLAPFFISQMRLLINGGYVYDKGLIEKISASYEAVNIQVIREAGMSEFLADISEKEVSEAALFLKVAGVVLDKFDCDLQIKRFYPASLPVLYFLDEAAKQAREINDNIEKVGDVFKGMLSGFAEEFSNVSRPVLYFNLNNPLVKSMIGIRNAQKLHTVTEMLYVQALLVGHFPVRNNEMDLLNKGILKLLTSDLNEGEKLCSITAKS